MNGRKNNFDNSFNVKFNIGFVLRVNPEDLQKIKNFIESLVNVTIVHSQVSGNRLYIKEENNYDRSIVRFSNGRNNR